MRQRSRHEKRGDALKLGEQKSVDGRPGRENLAGPARLVTPAAPWPGDAPRAAEHRRPGGSPASSASGTPSLGP